MMVLFNQFICPGSDLGLWFNGYGSIHVTTPLLMIDVSPKTNNNTRLTSIPINHSIVFGDSLCKLNASVCIRRNLGSLPYLLFLS